MRTSSRTGSASKLAGEEERRDRNLPEDDSLREEAPVEEAQGSPVDPDIVDETGAVDEESDPPETEVPEDDTDQEPAVEPSELEAVTAERDQYLTPCGA